MIDVNKKQLMSKFIKEIEKNNLLTLFIKEIFDYKSLEDYNYIFRMIEEKNAIIEEARKNASRIVNDALLRAEKIEIKTDTLERNLRIFKKKLKLVVEQQLTVIDEIEELELK